MMAYQHRLLVARVCLSFSTPMSSILPLLLAVVATKRQPLRDYARDMSEGFSRVLDVYYINMHNVDDIRLC